jgi:putative PIN family toxin of toxin-antitoxin system
VRRVVVDPGVLVSAIITPAGPPAEIVRAVRDGRLELVVSPHLLAELRAVLDRDKFRRYVSVEEVDEYLEGLALLATTFEDPQVTHAPAGDPADEYLLALARVTGAWLVSGDAGVLGQSQPGLRTLTPRALVDERAAGEPLA